MTEFHPLPSLSDQLKISVSSKSLNKKAEERAKKCGSAEMPSLDHLSMNDYQIVYEPSDDTYLLLDAILDAVGNLSQDRKQYTTLEIGCGTGVPTVYLGQQLAKKYPEHSHKHIVTDINVDALRITQQTAHHNNVTLEQTIECDLIPDNIDANSIDILLFNPPYVPTPDHEVGSKGIEASWAGGVNGRRVIDRAIPKIAKVLRGFAFIITVDDNIPETMADEFRKLGYHMQPWFRRRARNEFLTVQIVNSIGEQ